MRHNAITQHLSELVHDVVEVRVLAAVCFSRACVVTWLHMSVLQGAAE